MMRSLRASLRRFFGKTTPGNMNEYVLQRRFSDCHRVNLSGECLNQFVVFGEDHLWFLLNEYVDFYNTVRPDTFECRWVRPPLRYEVTTNGQTCFTGLFLNYGGAHTLQGPYLDLALVREISILLRRR